jgi:hypothetical protein
MAVLALPRHSVVRVNGTQNGMRMVAIGTIAAPLFPNATGILMDPALSTDPAVADLIAACRSLAEEAFEARLLSTYLIGSLAHGGFSAAVSDIGIAFLLVDPLTDTDSEQISALTAYCAAAHPRYGRRLSLFWSSPAAFVETDQIQVAGRFPAIDRLDLLLHGRPIGGSDLRQQLSPPTRRAVLGTCREDVLRFVRDPSRYGFLTSGAEYDFGDLKALARLCLFPARFLYTAATGEVISNDAAAQHALLAATESDTTIINLGLALRRDPQHQPTANEREALRATLPDYYRRFLRDFLHLLGSTPPPDDTTIPLLLSALDQSSAKEDG